MYVVREGYEGLVRGNTEYIESNGSATPPRSPEEHGLSSAAAKINLLQNLRFGDGELLKDGTSEYQGGRTLKGRYIVRVGWDDVRAWFSEVRSVPPFPVASLAQPSRIRAERSSELQGLRLSGRQREGRLQRLILSKRESMGSSSAVVTDRSLAPTCFAPNGRVSFNLCIPRVCLLIALGTCRVSDGHLQDSSLTSKSALTPTFASLGLSGQSTMTCR